MTSLDLPRRMTAEAVSTALLLSAVVGSGIMAERLAIGNGALALLANSVATGAALVALISAFGPISGAHMNPVVTLVEVMGGGLRWRAGLAYLGAQLGGAITGVVAGNLMFDLPAISISTRERHGGAQLLSEVIATFSLVLVIQLCARRRPASLPVAVACTIVAAYWFTGSTSFANPAVTLARCASDTFAGIRPADAPGFIVAQLAGAVGAATLGAWLAPAEARDRHGSVLEPT